MLEQPPGTITFMFTSEQVGLAAIAQGSGSHAWFDTFLLWQGTGG
jgi:hypothetical protein